MNRTLKSAAAAGLVIVLCATAIPSAANAGWNRHHNHNGAAVAAGIFGLAAGAIIGSALTAPRYYAPQPYYAPRTYYAPRPYRAAPQPAYYGPPAPWTPGWYSYCHSKYRSFNSRTGYFLGYDGRYHFCK